ncbi:Holliday junction branch migration protein RuvA [Pararhodobacter marinus]|uniref:Holliday junction branch migration complex subunit RuvA n=1 Tax=Pararhodobacter marinus TaxID=2184063 RepID=A0A2U2C5X1_9RHOB|nr:Holliday junction branch migration protein RuvA [Pararhodobacter marinus]PWE27263.1 Holliday junction branch migration protein RuvA [Pararhodobacter marinus]
MIGKLSGRIDYKAADHVLLDVKGVGYVVHVSDRTLMALPGPGGMAALYTELLVREDLLQLFGFTTLMEKEWHRLLVSVQGVGAKAAMAILGTLGPEGVARALAIGDAGAIRKAPGVGPKLAQRVVMELKDKAPAVMAMGGTAPDLDGDSEVIEAPEAPAEAPVPATKPKASARRLSQQAQADALSALTNLGYGPSEAAQAVATAAETETEAPALIRAALKLLAPK